MSFHATFPSVLVGIGLLVLPHAKIRSATFFRQDVLHLIQVRMCSPHLLGTREPINRTNERNGNRTNELGTKPNGNPKTPTETPKPPRPRQEPPEPRRELPEPHGGRIQFHPKQFHPKSIWKRERGSGALCKQILKAFFFFFPLLFGEGEEAPEPHFVPAGPQAVDKDQRNAVQPQSQFKVASDFGFRFFWG